MLDLKYTRDHLEEVKEKIGRRGQAIDWDRFARLDSERREILQESESLRAQRNQVSDVIAEKKKKKEDAAGEIARMKEVSNRIKELEPRLAEKEEALRELMMVIPNIPHESVVVGQGEKDNPEMRKWGKIPEFSFPAEAALGDRRGPGHSGFRPRARRSPAPGLPSTRVWGPGWRGR